MNFTQTQIKIIIEQIVTSEDGLNSVLRMSFEALMKSRAQYSQSGKQGCRQWVPWPLCIWGQANIGTEGLLKTKAPAILRELNDVSGPLLRG